MVILRSQNKITDFLMILAWASPFNECAEQSRIGKPVYIREKHHEFFLIKYNPVNSKHLCSLCAMLDQRRRHWAGVVQILCRCFVFQNELVVTCYLLKTLVLVRT